MFYARIQLLCTLISFSGMSATAQSNLYHLSATTGAACQQLEFYESSGSQYLFAGTGTTFRVYSLADPTPPYPVLFEYRFRSFITDIQLDRGFLFVASNHDGVSKWDISDPTHPQVIWQYFPETLDEASHDLSFLGDSIIVASNKKVVMLNDLGSGYERITEWGSAPGLGFISGGAVKDWLYAYTVGRTVSSDGVYLFDLKTMQQVSYYKQNFSDPENVVFGINTPYLHVMGGTQNYSNPLDSRGLFYTLDLSDPAEPELVFSDTITGFIGLAIANVRSGANLNDTIYVVTTAGLGPDWIFPQPASGQIYVYDATGQEIKYLTELYAGLWYFDIAIKKPNIYIASEWYGIETIDISNLYDEQELGKTLTGGWAMKSDVHGNLLAIANEGYGFKLYDISDPLMPVLTGVNNDPGFCSNVKFSANGDQIFAQYQTYTPFRVFEVNSFAQVGELEIPGYVASYSFSRMEVYGDRVFLDSQDGTGQKLRVIDVSDPSNPQLLSNLATDARDLEIDEMGRMFVCNDDSLLVYDLSGSAMELQAGLSFPGIQNGLELAVYKDTIFVFVSSRGLSRYFLTEEQGTWTLEEDVFIFLNQGVPQEMAADSLGLYLGYTQFGVIARSKKTLAELATYRTGLDFKGFSNVWPLTDLYCKNGYVFVTEYFGQTTILTMDPEMNDLPQVPNSDVQDLLVYPNPNCGYFRLDLSRHHFQPGYWELGIYDMQGRIVHQEEIKICPGTTMISVDHSLPGGVYVYKINAGKEAMTGKFVVYR